MRINVIGAGVVGKATGEMFKRFGHEVEYSDKGDMLPLEADFRFICVPESNVEEIVEGLKNYPGVVVIRSTVLPGTTRLLTEKYQRVLYHNPEFLREVVAEDDVLNERYSIVGVPTNADRFTMEVYPNFLLKLYSSVGKVLYVVTSEESELLKLVTNAYLSTLISFWNEVSRLSYRLGVNSHILGKLAVMDGRVSPYGALKHGKPYGGKCLPKDMEQILGIGMDLPLLSAVKYVNESFGGK